MFVSLKKWEKNCDQKFQFKQTAEIWSGICSCSTSIWTRTNKARARARARTRINTRTRTRTKIRSQLFRHVCKCFKEWVDSPCLLSAPPALTSCFRKKLRNLQWVSGGSRFQVTSDWTWIRSVRIRRVQVSESGWFCWSRHFSAHFVFCLFFFLHSTFSTLCRCGQVKPRLLLPEELWVMKSWHRQLELCCPQVSNSSEFKSF